MSLPNEFRFSQASLQDYVDCARRFQLRHARRLRWPAPQVSPALEYEHHLQRGAAFHRLIQRHLLGFPMEPLSPLVSDPLLRQWWQSYLEAAPGNLPVSSYPEMALSAPVGRFRLVAQYDLVAVDQGERAVIVDWKTTIRRPDRATLRDRLQTRVYPYLLVRAGALLNAGQRFRPEQVSMVYWFANFPEMPEWYNYDDDKYGSDHDLLSELIAEIAGRLDERHGDALLLSTDQRRTCRYCEYRSLCRRGVEAGLLHKRQDVSADHIAESMLELDFDFEQVAEIDYG